MDCTSERFIWNCSIKHGADLSGPLLLAHSDQLLCLWSPVGSPSHSFMNKSILLRSQKAVPFPAAPSRCSPYYKTRRLCKRSIWYSNILWVLLYLFTLEQNIAIVLLGCRVLSTFSERNLPVGRRPRDVSSIYLWSCTGAFSATAPSVAVSQVKLMSVLIVLLVITECSWSSAVSSLGGILSLRQSFLPAARSSNALYIIRKTRRGVLSDRRACL